MKSQISTIYYISRKGSRSGWDDTSFYWKFWDIVKENSIHMVNQFLFEGTISSGLNDTNICLISKTNKPNEISQFRPISLCNVNYKIISKFLCQRLKKVLPNRISETSQLLLLEDRFQTIL